MLCNLFVQACPCPCLPLKHARVRVYRVGLLIIENEDRSITRIRVVCLGGLDKETAIGELMSCVISETRSINRDCIHV